jgi:hypothetical protein
MMDRPRYILTLEALPIGGAGPPPELRLRRLLKFALRSCRLKCVDYARTAAPEAESVGGAANLEGIR